MAGLTEKKGVVFQAENGNGRHEMIEPLRTLTPSIIERLITVPFGADGYPLTNAPFEKNYPTYDNWQAKHDMAVSIMRHGEYSPKNIRFLVSKFAPPGVPLDPEVEALRNSLRLHAREALVKRGDSKETKQTKEDLKAFVESVPTSQTMEIEKYKKLVGLFGGAHAADILLRLRSEYSGLSVDYVKSMLADFIGNYLAVKKPFNPDDVAVGVGFLSNPVFQDALLEVIKEDYFHFYNHQRRIRARENDLELLDFYFDEYLNMTFKDFETEELHLVQERAAEYYREIFGEIEKPARIVDTLREGRAFPDVNQLINIKELRDKKRMLIADDMGLGKSGSAILTNELINLERLQEGLQPQCALVVTPSNVIPTWQRYLSDGVGGYFNPGQAPRVLVVNNLKSFQKADVNSYDYVIISHEKLHNGYVSQLLQVPYGMLIVDEIHKLKNLTEGVRAGNLIQLAEKVNEEDGYVALLSGTPVPNKVGDVAIILKLLYPERFRDIPDKELVAKIINGDVIDLRSLLVPRMQRKKLRESLEMPGLSDETIYYDLEGLEKEVYEVLLEDDEIEAKEKIRVLRRFLLNPALLDATPGIESSKVKALENYLESAFDDKNIIVMFVNDFIEDVIRGDQSILNNLRLPDGVEIRVLHGDVPQRERIELEKEMRHTNKKILFVVSGQTGDVGIDLSFGQGVVFHNEPWTKYDKRQQLGRVYREGQKRDIECVTLVGRNTIEEGIRLYIEAKERAIEKLLEGIPITEVEKELLRQSEDQLETRLEVNPEFAEYYFSSWEKLMNIFGSVKEIGEEEFKKFLVENGGVYAESYAELGGRSYQANASRVCGTLIDIFITERRQNPHLVKILDLASGPEMLRKHMPNEYQNRIYSLDINPLHFVNGKGDMVAGSFLNVPLLPNSVDYTNLSLGWHYTKFSPKDDNFERLEILREIHRALKPGGRAILNLIYSLDIRDEKMFRWVVETIGFKVVEGYSGEISEGSNYQSRIITLEKQEDFGWTMDELIELIEKKNFNGLRFAKKRLQLKDSRKILQEFAMDGKVIPVAFNQEDLALLEEEQSTFQEGEELKNTYGTIRLIPKDELIKRGFARILVGKKYVLFRRLQNAGVVVIK